MSVGVLIFSAISAAGTCTAAWAGWTWTTHGSGLVSGGTARRSNAAT